jgi:tetratricopeptide (TPR) repeat protein
MTFKTVSLIVRILIALGIGAYLLRFAGASLLLVPVAIIYGAILFLLFGISLIRKAGDSASQLFVPDDSHFRILPEYSVAEARAKMGEYQEAVDEYRKVIAQYPEDVYPHLRIAELALAHLHDPKLAELELLSAVAKAEGEGTSAIAAGRLADFCQQTLHDPQRALVVMQQLKERFPGAKLAKLTDERIEKLKMICAGQKAPKPPEKIAYRTADEETVRRRRGF